MTSLAVRPSRRAPGRRSLASARLRRPAHRALPARTATAPARTARLIWLDRLIRSSAWIPTLAVLLIGLVVVQVATLGVNAGIGRSVERAASLQRENALLSAEVSRMESSGRLAQAVSGLGMVDPNAGSTRYLRAGGAATGRAAARELLAAAKTPVPVQTAAAPVTVPAQTEQAPAAPAAAAQPATQPVAQQQPAVQQPAAPAPQQGVAQTAAAPVAAEPAAPQPQVSGGAAPTAAPTAVAGIR